MQILKPAIMEQHTVFAGARQPGGNRGVTMPEHPCRSCNIKPFGYCGQHLSNALRCGFQAVQGGITTRAEGGVAGLAAQRLDALAAAVRTITDQRMDLGVRDLIVRAAAVRTGEALGGNPFGRAPTAFDHGPGRLNNVHGRGSRMGNRLLAASWAMMGGARTQQPLEPVGNRSATSLRWLALQPNPAQPSERTTSRSTSQHETVSMGDLTTQFKTTGRAKKDTKDTECCQAVRKWSVELSTMERGSTCERLRDRPVRNNESGHQGEVPRIARHEDG